MIQFNMGKERHNEVSIVFFLRRSFLNSSQYIEVKERRNSVTDQPNLTNFWRNKGIPETSTERVTAYFITLH